MNYKNCKIINQKEALIFDTNNEELEKSRIKFKK